MTIVDDIMSLPRRPDRRPGPVSLHAPTADGWQNFTVSPLSPTVGAEINGLDLSEALRSEVRDEVRDALNQWKVVFFRDQTLTPEQQIAFASQFGEIEIHPFIPKGSIENIQRFEKGEKFSGYENEWHNDNTWREMPSMAAVLRAIEVPPVGGDTLFADMAAAYDNLPDTVKARIDDARAVHDWEPAFGISMPDETRQAFRDQFPRVTHPVVRVHPETGRRTLFVNSNFTQSIVGLDPEDSRQLLDLLYRQADRPEYQCRFRWTPHAVAMWDNRAVQHYAASDYRPARRVMERVAIVGDVPV